MEIAVIGSGISGLSTSLFLSKNNDVTLYEKNNYLGGHTNTKTINYKDKIFGEEWSNWIDPEVPEYFNPTTVVLDKHLETDRFLPHKTYHLLSSTINCKK